MGKLTARQAATLPAGKHNDGDGLWLAVAESGSKKWFLRVTIDGKRREMGLGAFPMVSLAEARRRALEARKLAAEGLDPIAERRVKPDAVRTFEHCAAAFLEAHEAGWQNPKHRAQWRATLATYAYPFIGKKPVNEISTEDVLGILSPIWTTKTETAKRVQGRIENVLDYCAAMKWRDPVNPARWRGHLDKLLPASAKVKRQKNGGAIRHHPAMDYRAVPAFVAELRRNASVSAMALEFTILTACRTGEVLGAQWSEIDLEAGIWTIPAARMKARREHRVPLSEGALRVLEALPRVEGNPFVFPGARYGRPLSSMAMLMLMRGMGYGDVPHGFRSSFRDWCGEVSSFPRDVAEMALAHVLENKVEAAYRRGDLFAKRRAMMDEWSDWCGRGAPTNLVELRPGLAVG